MKIELRKIKIRDLVAGYVDSQETWVIAYGGKLDVRPPYQREFVYKEQQRNAVINTVMNNFPLNVMHWAVREDETYEIIDGQQRTISLCQYANNDFSFMMRTFANLHKDEQDKFLDYELMVYFCEGKDSEKLERFKTINIAGEKLTNQELRNAVYAGSWVADAKKYFSKNNCPAYGLASKYMNGSPIRQDYLETAIDWISNGNIEVYMSKHQHDPNASALRRYFQDVITWTQTTFREYRKFMKGIKRGELYTIYKDEIYDADAIEKEIQSLILDDSVTNKSGIYPYILTREEKYLNIRAFSDAEKLTTYEKQAGICTKCGEHFLLNQMEADHITPRSQGGKTSLENCQMLCRECNRRKSDH